MQEHVIVVGDRFADFAQSGRVLTVSQCVRMLRQRERGSGPLWLHTGQGVSRYELEVVVAAIRSQQLDEVHVDAQELRLAGACDVHKSRESNVLVANLTERGGRYYADLHIHNDNELLHDNQRGLHVQGMVVSEASRQMFLAVGERYLAPSTAEQEYYYVIERMTTTFENFVFPLRSTLTLTPRSRSERDRQRICITCEIAVHQAGRRCALTEVAFSAFPPHVIGEKEVHRAERALAEEVAVLAEAQP